MANAQDLSLLPLDSEIAAAMPVRLSATAQRYWRRDHSRIYGSCGCNRQDLFCNHMLPLQQRCLANGARLNHSNTQLADEIIEVVSGSIGEILNVD